MKSPAQARKRRSFPLTDYNYLPAAETQTGSAAGRPAKKSPAFHKLSSDFIGTEMVRDYVVEFSAFTVIAVISAWPILLSIVAVVRMARGY